jgi:hypothetical protein
LTARSERCIVYRIKARHMGRRTENHMIPKQKRITFLEGYIARKKVELDAIPSGVRSGAYSTDEAILMGEISVAKNEIEDLADLPDNTARVTTIIATSLDDLKARTQREIDRAAEDGLNVRRATYSEIKGLYSGKIQIEAVA